VEDEEKDEQDEDQVDLEVEVELDYVAEEDHVEQLHLEPVSDLLQSPTSTTTSPSSVRPRNTPTFSRYSTIATLRIILYTMNRLV
jgi:hypothetical protein